MAKFEIKKSNDGQYYFNLWGASRVILTSEMYKSKQGCKGGIEDVQKYSTNRANFFEWDSSDAKFFFTIKAPNRQTIGVSEMYETAQKRDNGIRSVMENGQTENVVDDTD